MNFFFSVSFTDRAQDEKHSEEVSHFQEELADAHAQLQILQKQLDDELNKQPLTNQEVQSGSVVKSSQLPTLLFETFYGASCNICLLCLKMLSGLEGCKVSDT